MTIDFSRVTPQILERARQIQAERDAAAREQYEATRSRTAGEVVKDVGAQLAQSIVGLGQAAYGLGNVATVGYLDRAAGLSENFRQTQEIIGSWKSDPTQRRLAEAQQAFETQGVKAGLGAYMNLPALQDVVVSNIASLLPAGAAGKAAASSAIRAAGGVVTKDVAQLATSQASKAAAISAGLQSAGATNVDAINAIKAAGGDQEQQQFGGVGAGLIAGVATPAVSRLTGASSLEARAITRLMGLSQGAGVGVVRGVLGGAAREGVEESIQSSGEQIAQNVFTPNTPITKGVEQQATVGFLGGALLGGPLGGVTAGSKQAVPVQTDAAPVQTPQELVQQATVVPTARSVQEIIGNAVLTPKTGLTPMSAQDAEVYNLFTDIGGKLYRNEELFGGVANPAPVTLAHARAEVAAAKGPAPQTAVGPAPEVGPTPQQRVAGATVLPPQLAVQTLIDNAVLTPKTGLTPMSEQDAQVYSLFTDIGGRLYRNDELFGGVASPAPVPKAAARQETAAAFAGPPVTSAEQQAEIVKAAAPVSWRSHMVKDLGLKAASVKGAAWNAFSQAAQEAGVLPNTPEGLAFVRTYAKNMQSDEGTAKIFEATLKAKYGTESSDTGPNAGGLPAASSAATATAATVATDTAGTPGAAVATEQQSAGEPAGATATDTTANAVLGNRTDTQTGIGSETGNAAAGDVDSRGARVAEAVVEASAGPTEARDVLDAASASGVSTDAAEIAFNAKFDTPELTGKYSRVPETPATSMPTQAISELVANANQVRGPNAAPITLHGDVESFTAATGALAPTDARGAYLPDGSLHLIASNIGSKADLAFTVAHERGHEGLAQLLGDRLTPVTNRLMANPSLRPRVLAKMEEGMPRSIAAEEVLADMIANGERLNDTVMSKIRSAIRDISAAVLGYSNYHISDTEVNRLLTDTVTYQRNGKKNYTSRAVDSDSMAAIDGLTVGAVPTAPTPRYSRISDALQRAADNVVAPQRVGDTSLNGVFKVSKSAATSMLDGAKNLSQSVVETILPRAQLVANSYHLFKTAEGLNPYVHTNDLIDKHTAESYEFLRADLSKRGVELSYNGQPVNVTKIEDVLTQWEGYRKNLTKAKQLDQLLTYSTVFGIWPDSATEATPDSANIGRLWNAVGKEGQDIYRKLQAVYRHSLGAIDAARRQELAKFSGLPVDSEAFYEQFGKVMDDAKSMMLSRPYSPLQRLGNHFVTVRDADGKVVYTAAYDTAREAAAGRNTADLMFNQPGQGKRYTIGQSLRAEYESGLDAPDKATMQRVRTLVDKVDAPDDVRNYVSELLNDIYLQTVPRSSIDTNLIQRRNIEGFSEDAFRQFNSYVLKAANHIADAKYLGDIYRGMQAMDMHIRGQTDTDTTKARQAYNAFRDQFDAYRGREYSALGSALSQAGVLKYLSSPSQIMVNGMQTFLTAAPRMAARFGMQQTASTLTKAMRQFTASRGNMAGPDSTLTGPIKAVMDDVHSYGMDDATLIREMTQTADGQPPTGKWGVAVKTLTWALHKSEVFNRQVTAYAYAHMLLDSDAKNGGTLSQRIAAGDKQAIEEVSHEVRRFNNQEAHYDVTAANAAKVSRTPLGRLMTQFQSYRINTLAVMARDIRDSGLLAKFGVEGNAENKEYARKALAYSLGTQALATGAAGTLLASVVFAIMDAFGDDDDLTDSRTKFVNHVPSILANGVLGQVVDTSRFDTAGLLPYFGDRKNAPKNATGQELAQWYAGRYIGPWFGLVGDAGKAMRSASEGKPLDTLLALSPSMLSDPVKAYRDVGGRRNAAGVVTFVPSAADTTATALGVRTANVRDTSQQQSAVYQALSQQIKMKKRYTDMYTLGLATGDSGMIQEANQRITAWNDAHPDLAIRTQDLRRAAVHVAKMQANLDTYGAPTARAVGPSITGVL